MVAVITGDIINSQNIEAELWLPKLKEVLSGIGNTPKDWEIYRGDEFQLKCSVEQSFYIAIVIKALIKMNSALDVRLAIGIGEENYSSHKITESNGSAYINSGRLFDVIKKEKINLAIKTENSRFNEDLEIILKWCSLDFDNWSSSIAEIIFYFLVQQNENQEDIARKLDITQSSVSQRLKRANFDLILQTDAYFRKKVKEL